MIQWMRSWWLNHSRVILVSVVFEAVVLAAIEKWAPKDLSDFYRTNLRGPFFSSFLTMAGFLLSLKTFIVVKMKELVYDQPSYLEDRLTECLSARPNCELPAIYGPLRRLGGLLFASILIAFVSAVLQFTLGLVENRHAVMFCISVPSLAIFLLIYCLIETRENLNAMFRVCEAEKRREIEKQLSRRGGS